MKLSLVHVPQPARSTSPEVGAVSNPGIDSGNLPHSRWGCHALTHMAHFPQSHSRQRAPRVRVPNEEPVSFNIQDKRVTATLQKISMTGGLAQFNKDPGRMGLAEIRLDTLAGPVRGLVEFLRPLKLRNAYHLPFRFIALDEVDQARLKKTLHLMRQQGFGE